MELNLGKIDSCVQYRTTLKLTCSTWPSCRLQCRGWQVGRWHLDSEVPPGGRDQLVNVLVTYWTLFLLDKYTIALNNIAKETSQKNMTPKFEKILWQDLVSINLSCHFEDFEDLWWLVVNIWRQSKITNNLFQDGIMKRNQQQLNLFRKVVALEAERAGQVAEDDVSLLWLTISNYILTYRVSQKNVLIEQNHNQNWVLWG